MEVDDDQWKGMKVNRGIVGDGLPSDFSNFSIFIRSVVFRFGLCKPRGLGWVKWRRRGGSQFPQSKMDAGISARAHNMPGFELMLLCEMMTWGVWGVTQQEFGMEWFDDACHMDT